MSLSDKDIHLSYNDNVLVIHYHNSYIGLLTKLERWSIEDGYDIKKPFTSNIRLLSFYSQMDKKKQRTCKGETTTLLYYGLTYLLNKNIIHKHMVIVVEVDPSFNNNLVKKVYQSLGFNILALELDTDNGFTLMSTRIGDFLTNT